MFQYFKGQGGKRAYSHPILYNIESLYHIVKNNIRPLYDGGVGDFTSFQDRYDPLNKALLPYISVSCKYDGSRNPGGVGIIHYYPVILIDLDFDKNVKKRYTNPEYKDTKINRYITSWIDALVKDIKKVYPYTIIKRSYSGSLHILIRYNLLDDNDNIIIGNDGVSIDNNDMFKHYERIHKKVFNYFNRIYANLLSKYDRKILRVDDSVGSKINQLMVLTYDNKSVYMDNTYDIYESEITQLLPSNNSLNLNVKISDDEIICQNNTFIEYLMHLYNDDSITRDLNRSIINSELSKLLSHHNFSWVASLWYLSLENRYLLWGIMSKKGIYRGSSIPMKDFKDFNNYIESKHIHHISNPHHFTLPLKSLIKINLD